MGSYAQYMKFNTYARLYGELAAERNPGAMNNIDPMRINYQLGGKLQGYRPNEFVVFLRIEREYMEAINHQRYSESNGE